MLSSIKRTAPRMSLGARLALGFGSLLALLIAVAAMAGWSSHRVGVQVRQIVEVNNQRAVLAQSLLDNVNLMTLRVRTIVFLTDMGEVKAEMAGLQEAGASYERAQKSLSTMLADATSQEQQLSRDIESLGAKGLALVRQAAQLGAEGANVDATAVLTDKLRPVEKEWRAKVGELIALQARYNDALAASVGQQTRTAMLTGSLLAVAAVAVGVLVAWRIARGIQRPIQRAVGVAQRIAEGALDNAVERGGGDEVGQLLDAIGTMQDKLRTLVSQIRDTALRIQVASGEVAAGNSDLSQRTEEAASKLQQTSSSMEQLTGNLRQGADAAAQANQLSRDAASVAQRGGTAVAQVVATMQEISGSSKRISDIIGVIDGIAFQTNILALNAAVEAARAGEQGRGFAVVAGEVRTLAQRSAQAAKEIKALIGDSVDKVESGARLVGDAGGTMTEIVGSVQRVSDIISEVTVASHEQSGRVDEVNEAVAQLDRATQQNAALVEQGAAAAESLKEQAERLATLVSMFTLGQERQPAEVGGGH